MQGMDGITFLKAVRERFGDIPFVLFTCRGREEVVIEAINNGADFYLQKGGDPEAQFAELAHKIRQAVRTRQAERSLHDSERRLSDIIDFLPDATFAIDQSGHVIAWNRAIEEMTGIPARDMLGKGNIDTRFRSTGPGTGFSSTWSLSRIRKMRRSIRISIGSATRSRQRLIFPTRKVTGSRRSARQLCSITRQER